MHDHYSDKRSHNDHDHHDHNHEHGGHDHSHEQEQEQRHLIQVLSAFSGYRQASLHTLQHKLAATPDLPMYAPVRDRLSKHTHAINFNAHLMNLIISEHQQDFLKPLLPSPDAAFETHPSSNIGTGVGDGEVGISQIQKQLQQLDTVVDHVPLESDLDKVRSTLRQFVRDWSDEGLEERTSVYGPILDYLKSHFDHVPMNERGKIQILVPGSGLGRLVFEIVAMGFSCQGNEFSMFMLLASNFILNLPTQVNEYTIYPWIHSFSNVATSANQLQAIQIPDVLVSEHVPPTASFSMAAGDFIEIYGHVDQKAQWDIIVTCFFIDTAKDLTVYLSVIKNALKPNGIWINIGPLLYHFEGAVGAVEFTLDEVKHLIGDFGFDIIVE
ncbi:hypothetical protein BASA81_010466 [Batrachochytrium salamandrivorans]|nr:hypothetical protein BASA81_010466 [Batrachochytrium salamandrivorans]